MSNPKASEPMTSSLPQIPEASGQIEFDSAGDPVVNLDHDLINDLHQQIYEKKEEIRSKVYAVSCPEELFESYEDFMKNKADWVSTEALGIVEVNKQIDKIKKEGIKDKTIYLGALPLEASHYFLSKTKGSGLESAQKFIRLYKAFDQALADAKKDASEIKELEQKLAAASQGINLG